MNKYTRKISVLLLALVMVLTMAVSAFAAGNTPTSDVDQNQPAYTFQTPAGSVNFTIDKDIVLFNVDGSQILEPNVTYTYQVDPVTVGTTAPTIEGLTFDQTDDADKTTKVAVRSGVAGGVTLTNNGNVVFGTDNATKHKTYKETETVGTAQDKIVSKTLGVSINAAAIYNSGANSAGVYRYAISDVTTNETLLKSGIKRDDNYVDTLYLDVYTRNNSTNDGLEVYGYVLFKKKDANSKDQSFEYDKTLTSETIKVGGFDIESETGKTGAYNADTGIISDQYHTYNVEIIKVIEGTLADKTHNFPFKVDITNVANTISGYSQVVTSEADFYYVAKKDGTAANEVITNLDNTGSKTIGATEATSDLLFENNDNILITGLPVNAKVMVTELNDTADIYAASVKDTDDADVKLDNDANIKDVPANTGTAALKEAFAVDNTAAKDILTVKNELNAISPTNVVMRFAPYLFILGAGIMLLMVSRRRKAEQE